MKFATSYFYQIRNFKPWMIPISTAKWDPKWFSTVRFDKNHIINGLRCEEFAPGTLCDGLCHGDCHPAHPENCNFLNIYRSQLKQINFNDFIDRCEKCVNWVQEHNKVGMPQEPIIVMIVYETPNNPCSERAAIQDWFAANDIECRELDLTK